MASLSMSPTGRPIQLSVSSFHNEFPNMTPTNSPAGEKRSAETIFYEAVELPEDGRGAFLQMACGADAELRAEVDGFLQHLQRAGTFLKEKEDADPELEAELARL